MKKLLLTLLLFPAISHSEPFKGNCTAVDDSGKSEKVELTFFGDQELARLRFEGPVPDRYFSVHDHGDKNTHEYLQFATRLNAKSALKLQTLRESKLKVTYNLGATIIDWVQGKASKRIDCPRPNIAE